MAEPKRYEITVSPKVTFLPEQSDPEKNQFVFAYTITVTNTGSHWIITDAEHRVQEVKGQGVVGKQPVLRPGESFEYTSGASIPTSVGTMRGSYHMVAEDGLAFEVPIPSFTLSIPRTLH